MVNQVFTGTPTSRRFSLCPSSIVAGQPVLLGGNIPAVALDNFQTLTGGTTFLLGGTFALSVTGATALSPLTGVKLNPGAKVYADGGSTDATTGVLSGFTLDGNSGGVLFGFIDPSYVAVGSALTDPAANVVLYDTAS